MRSRAKKRAVSRRENGKRAYEGWIAREVIAAFEQSVCQYEIDDFIEMKLRNAGQVRRVPFSDEAVVNRAAAKRIRAIFDARVEEVSERKQRCGAFESDAAMNLVYNATHTPAAR